VRTTNESSGSTTNEHAADESPAQWNTVSEALLWGNSALTAVGIPSPRLDAEVFLAHVLDWNRARLYARPEHKLTQAQQEAFLAAVQRRARHEPVPYIVGHREFYQLDFFVDRRVLIPRPETELLVEKALDVAVRHELGKGRPLLADVGTGSGIVAVALAVHLPYATVYATDTSPDALVVAAANAARHGVASRVHLLRGDLLQPLAESVHIIAANLPYIPAGRLPTLEPDVVEYEPLVALDGGTDGLQPIRRLLAQAGEWLLPEGTILLEIGAEQGPEVVALAQQHYPRAQVELYSDDAGLDRVVCIRTHNIQS
jgi:release factor glutamine methyltransferase